MTSRIKQSLPVLFTLTWLGLASAWVGCRPNTPTETSSPPPDAEKKTNATVSPPESKRPEWTEAALHAAIKAANPDYDGQGAFVIEDGRVVVAQLAAVAVQDLSPLKGEPIRGLDLSQSPVSDLSPIAGMPILELYLEQTRVEDIAALKGMPLMKLYLSQSGVTDLSPLAGAPLEELNLLGTRVADVSPLRGMPLRMLWLNECPVADISPLAECPLESLTLHRTQVSDLRPLAGSRLARLHIGETPVTDLTPLRNLTLTRLIFDPRRIEKGLEIVRQMPSLRELGTTFEERTSPEAFWSQFPDLP